MKTNKDLIIKKGLYSCLPGNCFEIPKGSRVKRFDGRYILDDTSVLKYSIDRHDATYYGVDINECDIDFEGEKQK